jgi:hypothetical protein
MSWWDELFARTPDTRSLEQRRGGEIARHLDVRKDIGMDDPLFVAGPEDDYGGDQKAGKAYQDSQAAVTRANTETQRQMQMEDRNLSRFDKEHANPDAWDGHVTPEGNVMFNDYAATYDADTDRGRAMKKKLYDDRAQHRRTSVKDLLGVAPDQNPK